MSMCDICCHNATFTCQCETCLAHMCDDCIGDIRQDLCKWCEDEAMERQEEIVAKKVMLSGLDPDEVP